MPPAPIDSISSKWRVSGPRKLPPKSSPGVAGRGGRWEMIVGTSSLSSAASSDEEIPGGIGPGLLRRMVPIRLRRSSAGRRWIALPSKPRIIRFSLLLSHASHERTRLREWCKRNARSVPRIYRVTCKAVNRAASQTLVQFLVLSETEHRLIMTIELTVGNNQRLNAITTSQASGEHGTIIRTIGVL